MKQKTDEYYFKQVPETIHQEKENDLIIELIK